jgi:hypothetical protein
MNSLAADLPMASSPLRRSYTLNPRRMQRSAAGREVTRKPPLPRLAGGGPHPSPPPRQASLSPGTPEPFLRSPSLPRSARPTDLPGKLLSAFEGLCASPGARRRGEPHPPGLCIEEEEVLPPAARRPREDDSCSLSSQPSSYCPSPRAASEDLEMRGSGAPSPLAARRRERAVSSPPAEPDALSVLSCSLSEASEASGSRYDNVRSAGPPVRVAQHRVEEVEADDEEEEEEALSDSSNILDQLAEESSGSECGQYSCSELGVPARRPAALDNRRPAEQVRHTTEPNNPRHRDSGPYENVAASTAQAQEIMVSGKLQANAMLDFVMAEPEGGGRPGLRSLRTMLTKGQTSNV